MALLLIVSESCLNLNMINIVTKFNQILNKNENNKIILYNTIGAFLIKGGALVISLLTLPAYMNYFKDQQILGIWFTLLSVLSWLLTFDLGIGNGLRHHLVAALVNDNQLEAKKYISSAYIVVGGVVIFFIGISTLSFKFIDWNIVFNIPNEIVSKDTLNVTVSIVFCGILIQLLLKLTTSILYAMQKSAINNFLSLSSSIIILVYVLSAKSSDTSTNLISLAVINMLAINIPLFLATIFIFKKQLKYCRPEFKFLEKKYAKSIMKLGGFFFWVQIMYMIINTTNEFLIAWLTEPRMVVEYQIYNRLFSFIGAAFILALTPIWSAVTKSFFEKNYRWIKKLYNILKLMTLLAILCEFGMLLFLQSGINLWLDENAIKVNYVHATLFALYGSMIIWNGVISSIANGFGELKTQSICFTLGALIKIPIAWIFVGLLNSWIGVVLANIIVMSLYCIVQPIRLNAFLRLKELEGKSFVQK
ncbi:hypothetical protein SDC9_83399 [bioreactor metagenome]|uniref:Polysaccharide biosynthesis protein C-terminal domain-containing protein n=1 Tax=bioreactor metagenome TaxID=1076179 RepID=A0A644Z829_9ZZZZ